MDDIIVDGITYEKIKQRRNTTALWSIGKYIQVTNMLNPALGFTMEIVTDVERKSDHDIYITDKGNKVKSYDGRLIPYYQKKPPPFVFNHRKYGWWVSENNKLGAGPRWGSNDAGDAAPTTCVEGTCTIAGGRYRNRKSAKKVRRRRQNKTSRRNTKNQRTQR